MQQKNQINLQNQKKKSHQKKITGFQVNQFIDLIFVHVWEGGGGVGSSEVVGCGSLICPVLLLLYIKAFGLFQVLLENTMYFPHDAISDSFNGTVYSWKYIRSAYHNCRFSNSSHRRC